ncbi:MAG: radical SAM protein, partial [Desulfovibrionaceae bacterium]
LIPDFQGDESALATVLEAGPDVLNHNLETVRRLYPQVRPEADYDRSLELLARAAAAGSPAKSGLMLGLGETAEELQESLRDLAGSGVSMITMGQYMQPSRRHHPVTQYWRPEDFAAFGEYARGLGVSQVMSAPLVRSSYRAAEMVGG